MMRIERILLPAMMALVAAALSSRAVAQERKPTQAFKSDRPTMSPPLIYPSSVDAQMLQAFALMQEANAGNPAAQHELGLRYLLGRGFPADTVRAAQWIRKAAEHGLAIAHFNLGIFEANGWGTPWDPFAAFRDYREAANGGMVEALYVMGLIYGENFVVARNWPVASGYFQQAAKAGYVPAKFALAELARRGLDRQPSMDSAGHAAKRMPRASAKASPDSTFRFVFVDFTTDTVSTVPDTTLLREATRTLQRDEENDRDKPLAPVDSASSQILFGAAECGNPEALCMIGRLFERGIGVSRDPILAGVYYLRAVRLESQRAPGLLWKLAQSGEFLRELQKRSESEDGNALYVWAGLTALKFSSVLNDAQALHVLEQAAGKGHVPSMVELGFCAFTGRWMIQDRAKAERWWKEAAMRGSIEARIRLAVIDLLSGTPAGDLPAMMSLLDSTASEGSLLSDVTLAYCAENGIGRAQDKGEAYRVYHRSMRRGSETAYLALRRMHDELRPPEQEFRISD